MLDIIRTLPDQPGVYQYFDTNGKLLYIGKAKSLKNRVKSYWRFTPNFRPNPTLGSRIGKMLHEAHRLEYLLTPSEEDALILENSLIKQLKPKYNILLRDDKTYPYIYIDLSDDFPRFELTRKIIEGSKIRYYGPFPSGARALLDAIYEIYPLVQKRSGLGGGKACLFHQIGKCHAPCEKKISPAQYMEIVEQAIESINKKNILTGKLRERMESLAQQERFEEAARIRDWIEAIGQLKMLSNIDLANNDNMDIFAIRTNARRGVVVKMFLRNGRITSSAHTFFRRTELYDANEAYRQALLDHYSDMMPLPPKTILVADEIDDTGLPSTISTRLSKKIKILSPQKGAKKRLIDLASANAVELLKKTTNSTPKTEKELASLLQLPQIPYRVEIFDNSHMMGAGSVGGMVVWNEGEWDKKSYRHYALEAKDEYGQMRETLSRRIKDFPTNPPPDLWLLDGGETLRQLALSLLNKSGVNLDVVAISKEKLDAKAHRAKGAAMDIIHSQSGPIELLPTDKRLQWCQRLRDEAHRFAIAYHQKRKRKDDTAIKLLERKGIGPATVKKLLDYFGTFETIESAGIDELTSVVSKNIAALIINKQQ
jgi:excinuclease ABC subunit C